MTQTFHHRRGSQKIFWACPVFFLGMAVMSVFGALDAPPANRLWFLVFMEGVWLSMLTLSIWGLFAIYRESWQLSEDRLVHQGIFRRKEIPFSQATELKWRLWPAGGSVVLKSDMVRIAVDVHTLEREVRVTLIQTLRAAVPEQNQVGWPRFCQRWAVPLLNRLEATVDRPLQEGEIRITRARYDRALKIGLPVALMIMLPLAIVCNQPAYAFFPVFLILLWIFMRNTVPKEGRIEKKPSGEPGTIRMLMAIVICGGLAWALIFWIDSQRQLFPNPIVPQITVAVIAICSIFTTAIFADVSKRHHDEVAAPAAMERWESAQQFSNRAPQSALGES